MSRLRSFDLRKAWDGLSVDQKATLGMAAIAEEVALVGQNQLPACMTAEQDGYFSGYDRVRTLSAVTISAIVQPLVATSFPTPLPDISALGFPGG